MDGHCAVALGSSTPMQKLELSFIRCVLDLNYIGRRDGLILPFNSTDKWVTTRRSIAFPPVELHDGVNKED